MLVTSSPAVVLPVVTSNSAFTENGPPKALARSTRYPVAFATAFQRRLISPDPALGPAVMTSTAVGTPDLVVVDSEIDVVDSEIDVVDSEIVVVAVVGDVIVVVIDAELVVEAATPPSSSSPQAAVTIP